MDCKQTYKIPADRIADRVIEDEAVILNLDNGQYYTLNYIGTVIWKMLGRKKSLGEIQDFLKKEYSVGEETLKKDMALIIKQLEGEKLIDKA